jgi:ferrochelatase
VSDVPIGVLVMAYGTASGPDDIERYYTDIRGGRPPTPEHLAELKERYAAIGNRFPLLEITTQQADGIVRALNASATDGSSFRAYLGMKHSPPFVADAVAQMRADGIERAVGIVMAPHWSGMSIQTYIDRVLAPAGDGPPSFTFVRSFHDHPMFIAFLAGRVAHALGALMPAEREKAAIVFSAHSLPVRTEDDGSHRCKLCTAEACATACTYRAELQRTAQLVAAELDLHQEVTTGWQSAGRTADPWWGPPLEDVIRQLASVGHPAVVVCSAGFVSVHLEILYDLDIEARAVADEAGVTFARTEMPNDHPDFIGALAAVVRDHLEAA